MHDTNSWTLFVKDGRRVDVASFGDFDASPDDALPLTWEDPFEGVYKKLLFSLDGTQLLGGVLVGRPGRIQKHAGPCWTSNCASREAGIRSSRP